MLNSLIKRINLQPGEEIRLVVRRSVLSWLSQEILVVIFIAGPFFFMYPLFRLGIYGIIIFLLILMLGLLVFIRIYLSYYFTVFVLTSSRMIDMERSGFTKMYITDIRYGKIQNISSQKEGFLNSIFGLGDVYINLTGGTSKIRLTRVRDFERVVSDVAFYQDFYLKNNQNRINQKAIRLLQKIKRKIGEEEFRNLISD